MKKIITVVLIAFSLSINAQEAESSNLHDGSELFLFGVGALDNLGEDIYLGGLYFPSFDYDLSPRVSKRLEMRVAADSLSGRKFTRLWMEAITINSSRTERNQLTEQIQKFSNLFETSLMAGDHVSFDYIASESRTVFIVNKTSIGSINGESFFDILLKSWVGDTPFSAKLKLGLLNKLDHSELASNQAKYNNLGFTEARLKEIAEIKNRVEREKQEEIRREAALATLALEEERAAEAAKAAEALRLENEARIAEKNQQIAEQKAEEDRLAKEKERLEAEQLKLGNRHVRLLTGWVGKYLQYPERALQSGTQGRVEVRIVTDRNGKVLERKVVKGSESSVLDDAALGIVDDSAPLPEMPDNLMGENFTFRMPFNFVLDN